ncbi:MAG: hypothetical protein ACUVS1_02545, partial [Actinomycetota bacterium]
VVDEIPKSASEKYLDRVLGDRFSHWGITCNGCRMQSEGMGALKPQWRKISKRIGGRFLPNGLIFQSTQIRCVHRMTGAEPWAGFLQAIELWMSRGLERPQVSAAMAASGELSGG